MTDRRKSTNYTKSSKWVIPQQASLNLTHFLPTITLR